MRIGHLTIDELMAQGQGLLAEHYEELALHKESVKLEVDWEKYLALEKAKCLFALGAWEGSCLVGYALFFVHSHIHYKSLRVAMNDVLFLHKDCRQGFAGIRLIKECERRLASLGRVKIVWHVKQLTSLGPILTRLGYDLEEYSMGKVVGENHGL